MKEGLIVEDDRKHCAYFSAKDRGDRTVTRNSAQHRGKKRDVVKKRAGGSRAWFENEGFRNEIVDMGGGWSLRVKPFYMFTGMDRLKPLARTRAAAKATLRIKFDRNKNVETDLAFWASFRGREAETMRDVSRAVLFKTSRVCLR